jgi:hypothetical protein
LTTVYLVTICLREVSRDSAKPLSTLSLWKNTSLESGFEVTDAWAACERSRSQAASFWGGMLVAEGGRAKDRMEAKDPTAKCSDTKFG